MWFTGPEWLKTNQCTRRSTYANGRNPAEDAIKELKVKERMKKTAEITHLNITTNYEQVMSKIIESERFGCLNKLLRTTAIVLKVVDLFKSKGDLRIKEKPLTDYILEAEELWLKDVQHCLMSKDKTKNWEREFGLYKDERGIIRCGDADLTQTQKHPAILNTKHYVTSLIVKDSHERVKHNAVKSTLTEIRSKYWIVRRRRFVRKLIHRCAICRRIEENGYIPPDPPALPAFRTTKDHPFTFTGVDFAEPLYVKQSNKMEKTYLVLYTCAVSRAVHLDLVNDMSTEAFIRSLKRFTARRGIPKEVKSDNGKRCKAASRQLSSSVRLPRSEEISIRPKKKLDL
mgnify:CR=1 FL=1